MGADKANIHDLIGVIDGNDKSIVIAANVEYDAIIGDDTRGSIELPNVVWRSPSRMLSVMVPGFERLLGVGMPFPECTQGFTGNDTHAAVYHDPGMGTSTVRGSMPEFRSANEVSIDGPPPNDGLRFSCRRGAAKRVKNRTISRAEGGQLQAPVGRHGQLHQPVLKPNTGDPLIMALIIGDYDQAMFETSSCDQDIGIAD